MRRIGTGLLSIIAIAIMLGPPAAEMLLARSEAGHIYGALAYSKRNGAYGFSTGFGDSESANEYAMEKCGQRGAGCYVVISFSNLCASVAADDSGGVFWGTAGTRQEAQRQSMLYCKRDGDAATCEIKVWACSIP